MELAGVTIKTTIEWGLVVVVMMVALLPLLVAAVRSRKWNRIIIYTALWLIAPAVFSWMALGLRVKPILEADVTNRPIEVVTEGILARRLQDDPALEGVGLVIFDEFHVLPFAPK